MKHANLDRALAEQLETVELVDRGLVVGRIGFALELYFLGGESVDTRLALCGMLRDYHALFARHISHYLKVDANRLSKVNGENYLDYYEEKARSLSSEDLMDAVVFGYPGKTVVDEPTPVAISFTATAPEPLLPLGVSHICAYFPATFFADNRYDVLIDLAKKWASILVTLHGSAGYSVLFEHGVFAGSSGGVTALPVLKRFPGLDYSDPGHFKVMSRLSDGLSIKSINWLTIGGGKILDKLKAREVLETELGNTCPVHEFEGGLIFQAGEQPQLGDNNRAIVLDDYRRVAAVLKPVRFEDYQLPLIVLPEPYDGLEETKKWLRRFD